ncbi:MAG: hypothetical protein ACO1N2_01375 [Candidatus Saccharimonadota bacterium]|jgi:hypothetical protein
MLALLMIVIVTVCVVSFQMRSLNKSYYTTDRHQAYVKLENFIKSVNPPAEVVYSELYDMGCDRNGVGIALYTSCSIYASKYFKVNKNPVEAIKQLNLELEKQGYKSSVYKNSRNTERTISVPNGTQEGSAPYASPVKDREYLILYVEFFNQGHSFIENYSIKKLINDGKIAQPSQEDSIFGVTLQKTYWKCDDTSFFEAECPAPPSEPM